jgi:sugar O-acyltransferase (sialic acid O-acetyltransferase NeuD family)
MIRPKIILIGAGGHCRSCIDVIEMEGRFTVAGVVDRLGSGMASVLGYPVLGVDSDLSNLREKYDFALVAVGQIKSPTVRIQLFEKLKSIGFDLPVIQSPRAYVSKHAKVAAGTIVMHDALINAGASVGENCIINSKALIEHDAIVGAHCHISTGSIVNGEVNIGARTFFGSNAVSVHGISIPEDSFIPARSLERGS